MRNNDQGMRELWMAVFLQVIQDAIRGHEYRRIEAKNWLFAETFKKDRDMVCDMAGIEDGWQDAVRRIVENQGFRESDRVKAISVTMRRHAVHA